MARNRQIPYIDILEGRPTRTEIRNALIWDQGDYGSPDWKWSVLDSADARTIQKTRDEIEQYKR